MKEILYELCVLTTITLLYPYEPFLMFDNDNTFKRSLTHNFKHQT